MRVKRDYRPILALEKPPEGTSFDLGWRPSKILQISWQEGLTMTKITTMMRDSRQQFLAKDSKSELGKRSGETVVEERACGSWYSWAAAKRWEMCFVWGAAPRGTIYWERDQQDNKFLSLYAHAWKITKVDNERNPNGKRARNTEYSKLAKWAMLRSLWPGSHTQKSRNTRC